MAFSALIQRKQKFSTALCADLMYQFPSKSKNECITQCRYSFTVLSKVWLFIVPIFIKLKTNRCNFVDLSCTDIYANITKIYNVLAKFHSRLCVKYGFSILNFLLRQNYSVTLHAELLYQCYPNRQKCMKFGQRFIYAIK